MVLRPVVIALGLALFLTPWALYLVAARRSRAEIATAHRERDLLAGLLDHSQVVTYLKDLDGRYLMVNDLFTTMAGTARSALIGKTSEIFATPEMVGLGEQTDTQGRVGSHRFEFTAEAPDGRHVYESVKFPVCDAEGKVYAIAGVGRDVTAERRAVAELIEIRNEALAASTAKSAFVATMSHEIRTPMNAVIGMADLLIDTELDEHQRELVDTVRSSSDALLALINDILDLSKIESGQLQIKRELFSPHQMVESCLDLVAAAAAAKNVELICSIETSCPSAALGDGPRLRQILINLLSNAVKFTDSGQVVLTVSVATVGRRLRLTCRVEDTGIGIAPTGIPLLFASFSQIDQGGSASHTGTGLGLVISQRLAHAMDGQIRVHSVAEIGSTFALDVLLDPVPAESDERLLVLAPGLVTGRALLVDDNATSLRILERQLNQLGMSCTAAGTAAEAVDLVRRGLRYDVALLDMTLPGVDGFELGSALRRSEHPAAPLILLTTSCTRPLGAEDVFTAFLSKPVKETLLVTALTAALDATPTAPPPSPSTRPVLVRAGTRLRVLLAEDNTVNQRVAQLMMNRLGHLVHIVGDGAAAVTAAQSTSYDVVLMDLQMPRMDGLQATREIRRALPAVDQPCIIAMTANALVEDREACTEAGMDGYLTKPFRVQQLREALDLVRPRVQPARLQGSSAAGMSCSHSDVSGEAATA